MFLIVFFFTKTLKKAMKVKTVEYENGKKIREIEEIVPYDEEIYIPPNTTAARPPATNSKLFQRGNTSIGVSSIRFFKALRTIKPR